MPVYTPMCSRSGLSARKNAHAQVYAQDTYAQNKQNGGRRTSVSVCVRLMSWCQC